MSKHKSYMIEAVKLSEQAIITGSGGPFGAVIVKHGRIIAHGFNQVIKTNDPTAHAEVIAIREACRLLKTFDLTDCELYTSCEPCPMCLAACYWANIQKIYYSNTREQAENIGFKDNYIYEEFAGKSQRLVRVEIREAEEVCKQWENKADKIMY